MGSGSDFRRCVSRHIDVNRNGRVDGAVVVNEFVDHLICGINRGAAGNGSSNNLPQLLSLFLPSFGDFDPFNGCCCANCAGRGGGKGGFDVVIARPRVLRANLQGVSVAGAHLVANAEVAACPAIFSS